LGLNPSIRDDKFSLFEIKITKTDVENYLKKIGIESKEATTNILNYLENKRGLKDASKVY